MSTTPDAAAYIEASHFELHGPHTEIMFTMSDIAGMPSLTYRHRADTRSFRGDDVRISRTEIGALVTVTLEAVPDLHVVTLTLLLPSVNVGRSHECSVETSAFRTTVRTSIGGPRLVDGQIHLYETVKLSGRATLAVS